MKSSLYSIQQILKATKSSYNEGSNNYIGPRPIDPKGWPHKFPAKEHCSKCGLCETSFVQHVNTSCAFINEGMSRIDSLESDIHGISRIQQYNQQLQEGQGHEHEYKCKSIRLGVVKDQLPIMLAKGRQISNAQWTGVITSIALSMLEAGKVDAVVCIAGSDKNDSTDNIAQLQPKPILARSTKDVLRGRGVKPSLAPSLAMLDEIKQDASIQRLLFCGVGCAVQAFRSPAVQQELGLEKVYVLGTNCADNSPTPQASKEFISKGLNINEEDLKNVKGYEFMQDYQVHIKKGEIVGADVSSATVYEKIPYFSLPGTIARPSIADSCLACFDYTNSLADIAVGYMGAPLEYNGEMDSALQTLTVRNELGKEMMDAAIIAERLEICGEASGSGAWQDFAVQTVAADGIVAEMLGENPQEKGMPRWIGKIVARIVTAVGPKGINFASYSIDYHILRNYLHVISEWGQEQGEAIMPEYAKMIVDEYLDASKEFRQLKDRVLARIQ